MPSIVAYHDIDDSEHWLASPKRAEVFEPLGVTNLKTYVNPQNPKQAAITFDVADLDALLEALKSPEAGEAMQHDGVHPDTLVLLVEA